MSHTAKSPATLEPRPALCAVGELFGGVERQLLDLCQYFQRRGIQPLLILFYDRELAAQVRRLGVEPVILGGGSRFSLNTPRRLASVLADHQVNVVHAHGYRAVVNCALAHRHYGIRMVRTVHGRAEPRTANPVAWFKEKFYRNLETLASHRMGASICYVTDDLAHTYLKKDRNLPHFTVYNGIDPYDKKELARPHDLSEGQFNLLVIGRISAVKGIGYALRALLEPGVPDAVHLNVIGTGPQQPELEEQALALGIADRVHFLGFKRNVFDYLAHGDGLLMPSLHEGLPYVLLEAMAVGTPLLASQVAGLAEILHDRRTALLFPVGDVQRIGQAIRDLVSDPDLAARLSSAAQRDQNERFTLDRMGQQYWDVYQRALGAGNDHPENGLGYGTGQ